MVTAPLIARTEGYFPPELTSGKFSDKSDVFSYGVVRLKFMWYVYNYNLFQVTLETYTGLVTYKECRSDPKLVSAFWSASSSLQTELTEDYRQTPQDLESISDKILPPPEFSFTHVVYEVVSKCLRSHSKRPKSAEVKIITYAIIMITIVTKGFSIKGKYSGIMSIEVLYTFNILTL